MLSSHNRSEFLAVPQLIRFEYAHGHDGFEPTLLIKGNTILLKYIVLGARMQLAFTMCDRRLLCALRVFDDGSNGGILWSLVERDEELNAIRGLASGAPLVAFLFNELAVNVAWNDLPMLGTLDRLLEWADNALLGEADHSAVKITALPLFERLHRYAGDDDTWLVLEIGGQSDWKATHNYFIAANASSNLINLFDRDEGSQQEKLCLWLTENLQPSGAFHSPQIPKGAGTRELTDVLLSYKFGATLIESKTLSILARERLPDRTKLKRDVAGHIKKAFTQLRGAVRALRSDVPVTNLKGDMLVVERRHPAHAIVLIPDLELIEDDGTYGIDFIRDFMKETASIPHLLDISELLRVVQAAEMIVARSNAVTPMMAFDRYLMERVEQAFDAGTLCIEVLARITEIPPN